MQDVESAVREIQQRNDSLREELIASHKAFILRYTSFICKRKLDWANDDELSIALIAFNSAIDTFNPDRGQNFSGYARVLIKNRLIDYFRKQHEDRPVPLESLGADGKPISREQEISLDSYAREVENRDRAFELQIFKEELAAFGLSLTELAKLSPRHSGTRQYLKSTAQKIARSEELMNKIYKSNRLPLKEIQLLTGVTRKKLEKWRKYLLALVIILTNPDLEILSEYIWGKEGGK